MRTAIDHKMIDLTKSESFELLISPQGRLWINIDGVCLLRIQNFGTLLIDDQREPMEHVT